MRSDGQLAIAMSCEGPASAPWMRPEEGMDIIAELRHDKTVPWGAGESS